jgi:hypothetical protein
MAKGTFPDYKKPSYLGSFDLEPDKPMNPTTWTPPINWSGFVNNDKVHFIQISSSALSERDFDFTDFPMKYKSAIPWIIGAIDDEMKSMD